MSRSLGLCIGNIGNAALYRISYEHPFSLVVMTKFFSFFFFTFLVSRMVEIIKNRNEDLNCFSMSLARLIELDPNGGLQLIG